MSFFSTSKIQEPQINLRTLQEKTLLFLIEHKTLLKKHADNMIKMLLVECDKKAAVGNTSLIFTYCESNHNDISVDHTILPIEISLKKPLQCEVFYFNYIQKALKENYGLIMCDFNDFSKSITSGQSWFISWAIDNWSLKSEDEENEDNKTDIDKTCDNNILENKNNKKFVDSKANAEKIRALLEKMNSINNDCQ
jgi:hypothetical protein